MHFPHTHFSPPSLFQTLSLPLSLPLSLSLSPSRKVRILFEECFYNSRDESYQVFCLEQPLEGTMTEDAGAVVRLETLEDCNNYLWRDPGSISPHTHLHSHTHVHTCIRAHTVSDKVKKSVDNLLEFFQMEHGGSLRTSMVSARTHTHTHTHTHHIERCVPL